MTYTGGPLNILNGKMGISAPQNSVPVMKLIRAHQPKSKQELVDLITRHHKHVCECGVKSRGSVYDFGKNLYQAQLKYWGEYRFSIQECIRWEYDLFIVQSLKGDLVEKMAERALSKLFPHCQIKESLDYYDEELRIDLLVSRGGEELCGVQVKPQTFTAMRAEVIDYNTSANKKWGKPVYYLFYDQSVTFVNLEKVVEKITRCAAAKSV